MISNSSSFRLAVGNKLAIVRPAELSTDWTWEVRDSEGTPLDWSASLISNSQRHALVSIDSRYAPLTTYEVRVFDDTASVVASGNFTVERASAGANDSQLVAFNAKLRLAAGLAGINSTLKTLVRDAATGFVLEARLTLYTDASRTTSFASYRISRVLDAMGFVRSEVQAEESFDQEALYPSEGSGS